MHVVGDSPFIVNGVKIVPIRVNHGPLPILGFRIGDFAYITDAKSVEPQNSANSKVCARLL